VLLLESYQEKIQKQSLLVVNRIKEIGINAYKQEIGYSFRNIVEGFFSMFKRKFELENIKTEIFLKAMLINRFLTMNNY